MGKLGTLLRADGPLLKYEIAIHRVLRRDYRKAEAARKHEIHASLLSPQFPIRDNGDDLCLRRGVLAVAGKLDRYVTLTQLLRFEDGFARHQKWQQLLDRAKLSTPLHSEQTRRLPGLMTLCTPDKVIWIGRVPYVWECKGMNDQLFRLMQKRGKPPKQFVRRMHLYFAATGIPRGILHIEAKGTNEFQTFEVQEDESITREVLRRAWRLERAYRKYMRTKELPQRCGNDGCDACRP